MAGLLGMFDPEVAQGFSVDPEERKRLLIANALLGVSGGLLGARKGQELQGLGYGMLQGAGMGQQAVSAASQDKYNQFRMMSEGQKMVDSRKAQEQAARDQQDLQSLFTGGGAPDVAPLANGQGPTVANAAAQAPGSPKGDQYRKAAEFYAVRGNTEAAKRMMDMAASFDEEFSQTPQVMMRDGKAINALIGKKGTVKALEGYDPTPKFREVNDGKQTRILNDYNISPSGMNIAMQTTPGQDQSHGLELQKFRYQQGRDAKQDAKGPGESKPQWDPTTGQFVYPPSADAPSGRAVKPEGYQPKPPEHTRKELDSIDAQLGIVAGARKAAEETPSAFGMKRGAATMAGAVTESIAGRFDSPKEREARSYVYNVVSKVINERAGAAQSVQELSRLRSFLPAEMDDAKQIQDKLKAFETYLHDSRKAYAGGGKPKTVNFADLPQ
jgi:hypothetical protein